MSKEIGRADALMKEELLNKIIDSLYEGTLVGAVTWQLQKTIFNSATYYLFRVYIFTNETK